MGSNSQLKKFENQVTIEQARNELKEIVGNLIQEFTSRNQFAKPLDRLRNQDIISRLKSFLKSVDSLDIS